MISGLLQSSKCSGPQDALVPKVLRCPVSMGSQSSPVSGVFHSPLEEAAETGGAAGIIPVLGFSSALHFPPQ